MKNERYDDEPTTTIWQEYQKGVDYCRRLNMFDNTEKNYNFYNGKQWENAKLGDMKPIVINVIKPICKYKIGVINQNQFQVVLTPSYLAMAKEETSKLCELLSKHIDKIFENQQLYKKLRVITKDSCINSEGILYSYYNESEDEVVSEIVDKNNIMYGNETESNVQEQPYIIIAFRKPIDQVRDEAILNGVKDEDLELILPDDDRQEQAGNKDISEDITPMCLVLLKMYKTTNEKGEKTIHFSKCTKHVEIVKEKDTGLKRYPVAHYLWDDLKGSARGIGEVETNIPNQIEINKTEMRRAIAVKNGAYPKLVYNSDYVKSRDALLKTGATIELKGAQVEDVRNQVGYLQATSMSADSKYLLDELVNYTQNLAGAGDNATGTIDPTKTSGKAILAVQQAQQQPLNEQLYNFKDFLEEVARIYLDMLQAYKTDGLVLSDEIEQPVIDEKTGVQTTEMQEVEIPVTYQQLNDLKANAKVEITPKSPYDKFAVEQSLENLFMNQQITFEEYVNALPYDSSMPKKQLEEIIAKREQTKKEIQAMQEKAQSQMATIQNYLAQRDADMTQGAIGEMQSQGNNALQQLGGRVNAM